MSAPFTDEDRAFLRGILTNPADLTGWLAYADWLDERADPRAEFVRLEVRRGQLTPGEPERTEVEYQLRTLRKRLDPDWVAIFDRPAIENCPDAFAFRCPKTWESLAATELPTVRRCDACRKSVYYCHTIDEAREHASGGRCVAVALAVFRYPEDLAPDVGEGREDLLDDGLFVGLIDPDYVERNRPRSPPAPAAPRRPWWKFW
jgi:uncharacterized protein (TIGR02996 family)